MRSLAGVAVSVLAVTSGILVNFTHYTQASLMALFMLILAVHLRHES